MMNRATTGRLPSREDVDFYTMERENIERLVSDINGQHGEVGTTNDWGQDISGSSWSTRVGPLPRARPRVA